MTLLTVNFTKHCTVNVGVYVKAITDTIITNGNNDRTHACITLGPSENRQESINCFDLNTGIVVLCRTLNQMIWPERLPRKANEWGKKSKKTILKGQINFLNQNRDTFDWDNDYLTEIEMANREPNLVQPDL